MEKNNYHITIKSPVGFLKITSNSHSLKSIDFKEFFSEASKKRPTVLNLAVEQLNEYFEGARKTFDLPLAPDGTEFQKTIWKLVQKVKYGQTASYLEIAVQSGSKNNSRAVGLANGQNPIPIIIPCHRIIGATGKLTGYAGGIERKRWLLLHEKNHSEKENLLF